MASAAVIDIEQFLTPIAGENPCGENLRYDPAYSEIEQARSQRDTDPLVANEDVAVDWPKVIELATAYLTERSKDLRVAGYLAEALVHRYGFAGLRDGMRLICALVTEFWDHLHPAIDEDDLGPRVAPLEWLTADDSGSLLPNTIRGVPLARPKGEENGVISWNFWKSTYPPPKGESEDESTYANRKAEAERRKELFDNSLDGASKDELQSRHEDLQEALAAIAEFDELVDDRFGDLAPGTTAVRKACDDCGALLRTRLPTEPGSQPDGPEGYAEHADVHNGNAGAAGPIRNRQEAFRRLEEIATFLRQTDPHSPVSYLVFRAVKWAKLPFDDLLEELVKEPDARSRICDLLGIRQDEETE